MFSFFLSEQEIIEYLFKQSLSLTMMLVVSTLVLNGLQEDCSSNPLAVVSFPASPGLLRQLKV